MRKLFRYSRIPLIGMLMLLFNVATILPMSDAYYTQVLANGYGNLIAVKARFNENPASKGFKYFDDVMNAEYIPEDYVDVHQAISKFRFQDVNIYMSPTFGQGSTLAGVYIHTTGGESSSLDNIILMKPDSDNVYNTLFHEYSHHLMAQYEDDPEVLELFNSIGMDEEVITDFVAIFIQNEQRHGRYMDDILDTYHSSYMRDVDFAETFNNNESLNHYITFLLGEEFPDGYNLLRNNPNPVLEESVPTQEIDYDYYDPPVRVETPEYVEPVREDPIETPDDVEQESYSPDIFTPGPVEDQVAGVIIWSHESFDKVYLYWLLFLIVLSFFTMLIAIINA